MKKKNTSKGNEFDFEVIQYIPLPQRIRNERAKLAAQGKTTSKALQKMEKELETMMNFN